MKTLGFAGLCAALMIGLTGCGDGGNATDESMPNPGEESGVVKAMASVTATLYYEGSCAWLKCANGNDATGACGYGCSDTRLGFARDSASRLSCGQSVTVAANSKSVKATVWDHSCCSRFEGTKSLLTSLSISHGDGTCRGKGDYTYGYGQATATFTY
uniref:Lipoprotein n=1 Tax=Myxococcus fulvus TaxID=33 RepID=A0A3Q8GXN8_MYXFU|nr:hypothetical protein [Myxococcus fulvus]